MFGLTALGVVHTAVSLVAIVAGAWAFVRDKEIVPGNRLGKLYLAMTALTAASGLVIFQHGGFRIGHWFAVLTLLVVAIGTVAATTPLFGRAARYVQALFYSSTMLIHLITGSAETLTRLPPSAPLITAANAFLFKDVIVGLILAFLIGFAFQVRWLQVSSKR
jgi:uncharacterized membrane protein